MNDPRLVLVLNGPNLGRLGRRQPEVYGTTTLADIPQSICDAAARDLDHSLSREEMRRELIQGCLVEKGVSMRHYRTTRLDVLVGSIFAPIVAGFIIVALARSGRLFPNCQEIALIRTFQPGPELVGADGALVAVAV